MVGNSGDGCQNVLSVVVLPAGETFNQQDEPLSIASCLELSNLMRSNTCLNSERNLKNHSDQKVDNMNNYALCSLDVDIEKGQQEFVANWKSDNYVAREICLQIRGKFMQLLMNHVIDLPKFTSKVKPVAERACETPTNRMRKYKRYPSFNSRKVVLLFSVLSIMGTIILIYLTLRVRQVGGRAGNV